MFKNRALSGLPRFLKPSAMFAGIEIAARLNCEVTIDLCLREVRGEPIDKQNKCVSLLPDHQILKRSRRTSGFWILASDFFAVHPDS
jgi:hypothetical protein